MTQSQRRYFGTDGIRGTANQPPVTAEIALKLGMAAGRYFMRGPHTHRVVIAKDTRLSGYMLEPALTAGFVSVGMDVILVGPMPTPAVAMLTRALRADLGVMISASHNPFQDNGLKLFGPDGYKLSDEAELEIEARMDRDASDLAAAPDKLGRAKRLDDAAGRYIEFVKQTFPRGMRLDGLKIVLDCAHGAAYRIAPTVLWELGAEVITLGVAPNGMNINEGCGSTKPEAMRRMVIEHQADLGIALDGDADRLIVCDEKGDIIDGDQILAMIATFKHQTGTLENNGIVATQMSNMGLEKYLNELGISLFRTKVGDRYVVEAMRADGYNVGGEQSGHIVLSEYSTTGDGLIAALQVLAQLLESNRPASQAARLFAPMPQVLRNIRYQGDSPLTSPTVQDAVHTQEQALGTRGRVFIRASGTEPLIRVMVEAEEQALVDSTADALVSVIEEVLAGKGEAA